MVDPERESPTTAFLVRSKLIDGTGDPKKEVVDEKHILVTADETLHRTSAAYLLDCAPTDIGIDTTTSIYPEEDLLDWLFTNVVGPERERIENTRRNEIGIMKDYLENAFTELINDRNIELSELQQLEISGENVTKEKNELAAHIEDLKERRSERLELIQKMQKIQETTPEILSCIRLI